jgi:hypothetical protein
MKKNDKVISKYVNKMNVFNLLALRSALCDSSATEFEFQYYVFSRIVNVMMKQKTPEEAAEIALDFIPTTTAKLASCVQDVFYVYSWTFNTTMQIVEECHKNVPESMSLDKYFQCLGDLYSYARFALKLAKKSYKSQEGSPLVKIITNETEFEKTYLDISTASANGYSSGKRVRFLAKINSEISEIRMKEGKYEEVISLYSRINSFNT